MFPSFTDDTEEEIPKTYRGTSIDSKQEWWIILALNRLGKQFNYQWHVLGGRVRGGYIIDFYVYSAPRNFFIEYYGGYWHEGTMGSDDAFRERNIEHETGMQVFGIFEKDGATEQTIYNAVRKICV